MRRLLCSTLLLVLLAGWGLGAQRGSDMSIAKVEQLLRDGNERYVNEKMNFPNQTSQRRSQSTSGQYPYATVITCSDSRVPVEPVFDGVTSTGLRSMRRSCRSTW